MKRVYYVHLESFVLEDLLTKIVDGSLGRKLNRKNNF